MNSTTLDGELKTWQAGSSRIEYSGALLEELAIAATEGFNRLPHGGVEIGGVLFGLREGDSVKVLAHRAVECSYALGPSFHLSEKDRAALSALLVWAKSDPDLAGLQPVGLYLSHTRSELSLSEKNLNLFQDFFPEPWQIALVLRPRRLDPVRAGFFYREPDGSVHASAPRQEFVIKPGGGSLSPVADIAPRDRTQAQPVPAALSPKPETSAPEPASPAASQPEPAAAPQELEAPGPLPGRELRPFPRRTPPLVFAAEEHRRNWIPLAICAAVVCGALLYWFLTTQRSPGVTLHAIDSNGQLVVDWTCEPRVCEQSDGGSLEIEDGTHKVLNTLSKEQLHAGSLTYTRTSGNILARITVRKKGDGTIVQTTRFLGDAVPAPPSPPPAVAPQPEPPKPAVVEENRADRVVEPSKTRERSKTKDRPKARPEPPPRKLELPAVNVPGRSEFAIPALPNAPQIASNSGAVIAHPVPRLPAPATPTTAAAPSPRRGETLPQSGKMIWTGRLPRRGTLQIVGNHASTGHLSGSLPGEPVRIHVYPAELTQDGLRVFTGDAKSVGAPEAPGVQNGWNHTTYTLNPKQAGDVTIVEAPGRQNGWNRLVLHAERSDHQVIVLRWERISSSPQD